MQPFSKPQLVSLIVATAIVIAIFTVPIVTFVAFGDTIGSHTLYDAVLDAFDRDSRVVTIVSALVLVVLATGLYATHGLGFLSDRYALFAGLASILSIVPLVIYHANAQRIEVFGYELASTSIAFGAFVPAIIGVVSIVSYRLFR